jgi:hypothetical protein
MTGSQAKRKKSSAFFTISRPHLLPSPKRRVAHRSVEVRRHDFSRLSTTTDRILGENFIFQCPLDTDLDKFFSGTCVLDGLQDNLTEDSNEVPNLSGKPDLPQAHNLVRLPSFGYFAIFTLKQSTPLSQWLPHRQTYLDELLRADGRKGQSECACGDIGVYRCRDCFYGSLHCERCLLEQHRVHPFHRILVSSTYSSCAIAYMI